METSQQDSAIDETELVECDSCHDCYPPDHIIDMSGIADGQNWCRNCAEEFAAFVTN